MFKYLLLLFPLSLYCMEEDHPRFTINNRVVYLKEHTETIASPKFMEISITDKEKTVTTSQPTSRKPSDAENVAIIQTGLSNKNKVILASIGAGSSIAVAALSAIVTYYSSKC